MKSISIWILVAFAGLASGAGVYFLLQKYTSQMPAPAKEQVKK